MIDPIVIDLAAGLWDPAELVRRTSGSQLTVDIDQNSEAK